MTNIIKSLGEVQSIYDNIWTTLKVVRYCLEEVNEGCCCRGNWVEGKLVGKSEVWGRRLEGWIYEVPDYNALSNP
jgi:hypothetical protein